MRIKTDAVVAAMQGTTKNSALIFVHNPDTGAVYARAKTRPRDPKTYEQRCARDVQRDAAKVWATLTDEERAGWHAFAQFVSIDARRRRALDVCRESARMRLMLGLQPCTAPPTRSYPGRVREVTVEPSAEAGELRLRVVHTEGSPDGTMLLVRMTPEMKPGVTPRPAMARAICAPGPQSAVPLPESGGVVTFTGVQFAVTPGRHFGIDARIVRAEDGLASPSSFFDLVMPAPTPIGASQGKTDAARQCPEQRSSTLNSPSPSSTGNPPVSGQGGTGILPVSPAPLAPPSLSHVSLFLGAPASLPAFFNLQPPCQSFPGSVGVPASLLRSSTARLHRAAHPFPSLVAARSPLLVALLPSGAGRGPPGPGLLVVLRGDALFSAPARQPNLTLRLKAQAPTARGGCFSP